MAAYPNPLHIPMRVTVIALSVMAGLNLVKITGTPWLGEPHPPMIFNLVGVFLLLGWVVTAAAFITWLYQARQNLEWRDGSGLFWAAGWTIGAWFIPLANLVIVPGVVGEVYGRSRPGALRTWRMSGLVIGWWVALVLSIVHLYTSTVTVSPTGVRTVTVHGSTFWNLVNGVSGVVAAALAVRIVRRITAWQAAATPPDVPASSWAQPA